MKFPKNRANLYLVERWTYDTPNGATVVVGAFDNIVAADEFKDACYQEWIDKEQDVAVHEGRVLFNVVLTTYYG